MELTIDQALQQGIAAHRDGRLQDAERFYRSILQAQPTHPHANHNLGLLAVAVEKTDVALPLFKAALEANPKMEQFWLSYIEALIKGSQFDIAKQVLSDGEKAGLARDKVDALASQLGAATKLEVSNGVIPPQQDLDQLMAHYQGGRFVEAEGLARSITKRYPGFALGWKVLGIILGQTGREAEALNAKERSVQLTPKDAEAHNNFGNTLKKLRRFKEAEASFNQAIALKPDYAEAHNNLGNTLQELGRLDEALASLDQATALKPDFAQAHSSLGNTLRELGRLDEALASYNQATVLKPNYAEAHNNLGNTLQELGRLDEALASYNQAISLKPDYAEAHNNLGNTLKGFGRLDEALASFDQAIALKADYAEAHGNLGNTLQELGRLEEAVASFNQAISLKPDYAEAHSNLGNTLQELGRLDEALASYNQAISLKPDFDLAHFGVGKIFYIKGNLDLARKSIVKAKKIEPKSQDYDLMLSLMKAGMYRNESEVRVGDTINTGVMARLISNPLILNRSVEPELISSLYEMNSIQLDKTKRDRLLASGKIDARYGNGIVSPDFALFRDTRNIIQKVAEDLTKIMIEAVNSDIYIYDSFFNILRAGGGTTPHAHLNTLDRNIGLGLAKKKYSLVYYLSVGDQDCSEPGTLKLFDPDEDILPCEGMILIIPAAREHSSVYGGKTDRVMIGVNFYSL